MGTGNGWGARRFMRIRQSNKLKYVSKAMPSDLYLEWKNKKVSLSEVLTGACNAGLEDSEIAKRLSVPKMTVTLWREGRSHPHPVYEEKLVLFLAALAEPALNPA